MTVGSLFAGIGGFELAAQWAGLTPVWSNEIDPFCCKVLRKNFKHRIIEDDIRNIGAHNLKPVDIITGGFPCQPFSVAGKRKGKEDNRYLWPEMLRVIREIQPTYILGENVYGILTWSRRLVFEQVCIDLENEGYEIQPVILPACSKNAPHERNRVWFVAHSRSVFKHCSVQSQNGKIMEGTEKVWSKDRELFALVPDVFDGFAEWRKMGKPNLVRDNDGVPDVLDRLRGLGNAIVPQVAYEIFKAIIETARKINPT